MKESVNVALLVLAFSCASPITAMAVDPQSATHPKLAAAQQPQEPTANTTATPKQILRTGIDISAPALSPNSCQLADQLKLTPVLSHIDQLRAHVSNEVSLDNIAARQELDDALVEAQQIVQEANLAVDFTLAEISAEQGVNTELLSTYQSEANRAVQVSNWGAYFSNGALWAVAEALDIPTAKRPKYAIGSGINGIIAGVIPSIASVYAMHAANGKKHAVDRDENMLAKLFNIKPEPEVDYPAQVWTFLDSVPVGDRRGKTRRDQLIDRWISDKNIPSFTDRNSKGQVDLVAGLVTAKKAGTIDLMSTRNTMLTQLSAEILKEKRLLYELSMAVHGEKRLQVAGTPQLGL